MTHDDLKNLVPPPRTTCACSTCVSLCKTQPGSLIPGDFEKIAAHLHLSREETKQFFWASPGAVILTSSGKIKRQGTITPRYDKRQQRCVFLQPDDRCAIHSVAPAGCALFDAHMSAQEGQERGLWVVEQQRNEEYQKLRSELPFADHYKPKGY